MRYALAFVTVALASASAVADPAPKVCVAVAGDPDEAVRTLARETDALLSEGSAWRVVADASTRDALRGESGTPADQADRAVARRALRSSDADVETLDSVGDALGCAWFVTLASRAAGIAPRVYDVARHRFLAAPAAGSFDAHGVVLLLSETVRTASNPSPSSTPTPTPAAPPASSATPATTAAAPAPASASTAHRVPTISRVWPWLVVGAVVLGLVGAAVLLQSQGTPQTTLTVLHQGGQ